MIERDFGPFRITLEPQAQAVDVRLAYAGALLWSGSLSPVAPQAPIDVAADSGACADGAVRAEFGTTAGGQLQAEELSLRASGFATVFTGTIAFW